MSLLTPSEIAACAQVVGPLLANAAVADTLATHGVDVKALRTKMEETLRDGGLEGIDTEQYLGSYGEDRSSAKEQDRNIGALLRQYSKRQLSGSQVYEALNHVPHKTLVTYIMVEIVGWKPKQTKKPKTQEGLS